MRNIISTSLLLVNSILIFAQQSPELIPNDCGAQNVRFNQDLTAEHIPQAQQYEFRVSNSEIGYSENLIKNNRNFRLEELAVKPDDYLQYKVEIRVDKGNGFGPFGEACLIRLNDE